MAGPNYDRGMNIDQVISAPLVAASQANAMMLRDQARFLLEFCFDAKEKRNDAGEVIGYSHSPRMIDMQMKRLVIDPDKDSDDPAALKTIEMIFSVPVLTLIPINTLAVDEVNIEFDMEITSQSTEESDSQIENKGLKDENQKTQLKGKITYDSKESGSKSAKRQNSSKLKVNVHAKNLPLPVGVTAMLDMYVKAIHPIDAGKNDT